MAGDMIAAARRALLEDDEGVVRQAVRCATHEAFVRAEELLQLTLRNVMQVLAPEGDISRPILHTTTGRIAHPTTNSLARPCPRASGALIY